ncbi:deoxyhypusine synthase-like protein [Terfezia boudieri ATCC MYA-4762]|uniref:deoxyhypusine synthase n=1 Tax=Terfezia boudieri ATCC MYA-4762 TaxID=1051890 RepID=A0A3N4LY44_9PEZI|nr:deoxyhypusine synthase-like protein [Terfezia boudieri ATCC MYA-4762]
MPSPARHIPSSSPHSLTAFPPPPSPTPSPAQPAPLCFAPIAPPTSATGAVLVQSAPIPPQWKSRIVHGLDFNDFAGTPVTASDLVSGMSRMGFQASNVSTACQLIDEMRTWRDPETSEPATIFLGYTSNLVSSGLRETLRYLVEHKHVSAIVTTAGGIEEDIIKCLAPTYLGSFSLDGATLRSQGLNRIGNLLVPNNNYCAFEDWVMPLLDTLLAEQTASQNDASIPAEEKLVWTPSAVIARLGKEINNEKSILYWAWKNSIPIFCPALTDGSLGDMLYFHSFRASPGRLVIDIVRDIRNINSIAVRAKAAGMVLLGGGVVKHHIANACLMRNGAEWAVMVNVAGEFDGSDAGARPDEAVSWGKIKPVGDGRGGRGMVKVYAEATVVFPLIVAATWARQQQEEEEKKKVNVDAAVNGVVNGGSKV